MKLQQKTYRIELHIDRASVRRALLVGGSLVLLAVVGVASAVPVTFADGAVLTAQQLNDNFASLEQRIVALESGQPPPGDATPGGTYVVRASVDVPANIGGPSFEALCNPGDRILAGSCHLNPGSAGQPIWQSEPILTGTQGWRCGGDAWHGFNTRFWAVAMCGPQ